MCAVDSSFRERHLPFEGLLEALVRLATIIPLPTDALLSGAGFKHAGTLLASLETGGDSTAIDQLAVAQGCEWGGSPDTAKGGAMHRRVDHLVDIIVRKIKGLKEADEPLGLLTRREFRAWALRNLPYAGDRLAEAWMFEAEVGETS